MIKTTIGVAEQNNSGGFFIENEHVQAFVAIEGFNKMVMNRFLDVIVKDYSSYCECCGRRWSGLSFYGHEMADFNFNVDENEANCIFYHINGKKSYCYLSNYFK